MKPVITIGVCAKNCENTITYAIDSIIIQDFPHRLIEVIFVDDGSEDRTLSIIKQSISKMDISTKVFHQNWLGLAVARQKVVDNSNGDYILWVDGDMILMEDYVKKQVEFMEKNADVGICKGNTRVPWENFILALELLPWIIDVMEEKGLFGAGGATYRVKAIRLIGGFDKIAKETGEDCEIASRVLASGWQIRKADGFFYETHGGMKTWIDLWRKYYNYGHGSRHLYQKKLFSLPRMVPIAGFIAGFLYSLKAYKTFYKRRVFLLPIFYAFKMFAWCTGFAKANK